MKRRSPHAKRVELEAIAPIAAQLTQEQLHEATKNAGLYDTFAIRVVYRVARERPNMRNLWFTPPNRFECDKKDEAWLTRISLEEWHRLVN